MCPLTCYLLIQLLRNPGSLYPCLMTPCIQHWIYLCIIIWRFSLFQDTLYSALKASVHGFRERVGAPDTPRWNSVLFGGKFIQIQCNPLWSITLWSHIRVIAIIFAISACVQISWKTRKPRDYGTAVVVDNLIITKSSQKIRLVAFRVFTCRADRIDILITAVCSVSHDGCCVWRVRTPNPAAPLYGMCLNTVAVKPALILTVMWPWPFEQTSIVFKHSEVEIKWNTKKSSYVDVRGIPPTA